MTDLTLQSEIYSHGFHGIARLIETLTVWRARHRGRVLLAQMDAHDLKDLGLSRSDVYAEIEKPFWRA
ncbi:MAG: DUF1127 domain-containing protein [Acidobacteriota bacterium]